MRAHFAFTHHNAGGHFLIWSVYYLAGKTDHIVNSGNENAHDFYVIREFVDQYSENDFAIGYIAPDRLDNPRLKNPNIPCVVLSYNQNDVLNIHYNDRNPISHSRWLGTVINSREDLCNSLIESYHGKGSSNTEFIWDKRELFALCIHQYIVPSIDPSTFIDVQQPHLLYTTDDVWNGLPTIIDEIFNFLGISIDESRRETWVNTWLEWRNVHDRYFARHFDRIVNAIVNNEYLDLSRFNLDFLKEALIQNALLIKHDLNLKTWGLEKFPDNAQDLHKLLEPNFHKL